MTNSYFVYVGIVAAAIILFLVASRFAAVRSARNRRLLLEERNRNIGSLPPPVTQSYSRLSSGQVWTPNGFRPASEVYGSLGEGRAGRSLGTGVTRVDGAVDDNQLPSYGAPSIPVPESVYAPAGITHTSATEALPYQSPSAPPPGYAAEPPKYA